MDFIPSAFHADWLYVSRWELIKLFFGNTLKQGAMHVKVR